MWDEARHPSWVTAYYVRPAFRVAIGEGCGRKLWPALKMEEIPLPGIDVAIADFNRRVKIANDDREVWIAGEYRLFLVLRSTACPNNAARGPPSTFPVPAITRSWGDATVHITHHDAFFLTSEAIAGFGGDNISPRIRAWLRRRYV